MNAPIRRLSAVVALLFMTLLVSSTWIQFFVQAKERRSAPTTAAPSWRRMPASAARSSSTAHRSPAPCPATTS